MRVYFFILFLICFSSSYPQDFFLEKNSDKRDEIVARVGTINITAEEFIYNYEFGPAFPKRKENSKLTHLNYMINEKLLAVDGYEKGLLEKEGVKEIYNDIESDLAAEEMFQKEIISEVKVTEAEIEKVILKKQTDYQIRWLYTSDLSQLEKYLTALKNELVFDSLFNAQLNDSVLIDDRMLKSSHYDIYKKNPQFAQIIDSLKPGNISEPIHTDDGWYIIRIDNVLQNMITNETEYNKLKSESINVITKSKLGILSDQYVKKLLSDENPVIKGDVFNVLRSYLGKYILEAKKYSDWDLDNKLEAALKNLGLKRGDNYPGLILVKCKNTGITLDEFLTWHRNREQYIKYLKNDLTAFSKSLENSVWLMIRDKLLAERAYQKGYNKSEWVTRQAGWWRDKVIYSAYKNELANSVLISSEEQPLKNVNGKSRLDLNEELSKKILYKILELKKKYKVYINEDVLDVIEVSSENDKRAIDMYVAKRGSLMPRPAFPSIDQDWAGWE